MQTSILFLIFNRPELAAQTFERIREARPEQLFIAADGPRSTVPEDARLCIETRRAVLDRIDWPCEVHTLLRDENLGCKIAISSAIDWFFEHVEEGIILEDDCLPDSTFFSYCAELLHRYRNDNRIMMVSGNNFLPGQQTGSGGYFFSRCVLIWGWATWRRAWKHYDVAMTQWPKFKQTRRISTFLDRRLSRFWDSTFDYHFTGKGTTWDVQWVFACWQEDAFCILPAFNMVKNIGDVGVHMKPYDPCIQIPSVPMDFPLPDPLTTEPSIKTDRILMNRIYRSIPATVYYIVAFLFRSLVSRDRNLWHDLRQVTASLKEEISARYLS